MLFGAYGLQWVYYYSTTMMIVAAAIGLPLFAFLIWRFLYNSGRSGTVIQRRFGPIFIACFPTIGLFTSLAILNQQGNRDAILLDGTIVSGYRSDGAHGRHVKTVAHSKVEFTLGNSSTVYSVRAPLAQLYNSRPGNLVYVCKKKGLLFVTYYELTAPNECV